MVFKLSNNFNKIYSKCDSSIKKRVDDKLAIFCNNDSDFSLKNHSLKGKFSMYHSTNITDDWRALYTVKNNKGGQPFAYFETLGTHSQLYK